MDNKKKHSDVVEQLTALKQAPFWELFFDSALEQRYQYSQQHWYQDAIRASSLLAALLIMASHLVDWAYAIALPVPVLLWRVLVVTCLLGTYLYARRTTTGRWLHWLASLNGLMVVASFLLIARNSAEPIKQIYYTNIFFVEIVLFAFIRPPINFASTTALLMVLMVAPALYLDQMGLRASTYLLFLLLAGTLLCMMIALRMEKFSRKSFLQNELIQLERDQLRDLNAQMGEQFSQDRVTRLQNRVTFEDALLQASESSGASGRRIMLLAVQVEQFARFNDMVGADRGDDLLRNVARQLRTLFNEVDGCAARLGGGRFIALCHVQDDGVLRSALESLRQKLLELPVLAQEEFQNRGVGLTWGGVHVQMDSERDPRTLIDRIFKHLIPVEAQAMTYDHYQTFTRRAGFI